jgi:opacity protein-like surface antigen
MRILAALSVLVTVFAHQDPDAVDFGTGFSGGAALGVILPFGFRVEGEFGFIHAPVNSDGGTKTDGSFNHYLFMANAYYHFDLFGPIKPYVGFGLGASHVHEDWKPFSDRLGTFFNVDETRTEFAYQARAGITFELTRQLDLSAGYRFVHVDGGNETTNNFPITLR